MKFKKTMRYLLLSALFFAASNVAYSQEVAIKTNLLYDATTTPNLGIELATGKRQTVQLFYGLNAWEFDSKSHGTRQAKHWVLMPEYRWWFCTRMNGWFLGVHAMGGQFNAGNIDIPLPGAFFSGENLRTGVRDYRYEGKFLGGGITAGYQWILGKHWNLEAELGIGYDHVWYDKYPCSECGTRLDKAGTNYVGVTKAGISLMYVF